MGQLLWTGCYGSVAMDWLLWASCYGVVAMDCSDCFMVETILQIIMAKPAGGPKPKENPNWDED